MFASSSEGAYITMESSLDLAAFCLVEPLTLLLLCMGLLLFYVFLN